MSGPAPDALRLQLVAMFQSQVFDGGQPPPGMSERTVLRLFRAWVTEQVATGGPAFQHFLDLCVAECEGALAADPGRVLAWRMTARGIERVWKTRGGIGGTLVSETN